VLVTVLLGGLLLVLASGCDVATAIELPPSECGFCLSVLAECRVQFGYSELVLESRDMCIYRLEIVFSIRQGSSSTVTTPLNLGLTPQPGVGHADHPVAAVYLHKQAALSPDSKVVLDIDHDQRRVVVVADIDIHVRMVRQNLDPVGADSL
jgi:hypothetical protein